MKTHIHQLLSVIPVLVFLSIITPNLDAAPLLAHYRFDNPADFTPSTGDSITDSSGNNRHGTEGSNITWNADGVRGGAIVTSAATNGPHFSVALPPGLVAGDSFTISFWVRTGATGTADNWKDWGRLDFSDGTTTQHVQLRSLPVAAPNNGGFYFRDPAYEFWPRNSAVNVKDNQWHMLTAVADGTTLTLYIDGGSAVAFTDYPRGGGVFTCRSAHRQWQQHECERCGRGFVGGIVGRGAALWRAVERGGGGAIACGDIGG